MTTELKQKISPAQKVKREERQRLEALYWGGVLIWAGLIFGIESTGGLPEVGEAEAWSWVFFGAGVYSLLLNLWHASSPDRTNPTTADNLWGIALTIIGIGGVAKLDITWPVLLILFGGVMLFNVFKQTE